MTRCLSFVVLVACSVLLFAGCGQPPKPAAKAPEEKAAVKPDPIVEALAKLSPEDRKLAEAQKFCAMANDSRLGSMGPPHKVTIEGQTVFLCCKGCEKDALEDPTKTLASVEKLKQANK